MRFFLAIYDFITAPLYRRLYRETSLQLQEITKESIEHHERTSRKILDELLRLSLLVEGPGSGKEQRPKAQLSRSEMAAVFDDIHNSLGVIEACEKHDLPLSTVFEIKSGFQNGSLISPNRAAELELERESLAKTVAELTAENTRLTALTHKQP